MKIEFACPNCGHREHLRVIAVGWSRLIHKCPVCATHSMHRVHLSSAGLILMGASACWGFAFAVSLALELSFDITLIVFSASVIVLALVLGERMVNVFSSWTRVGAEEDPAD